LFHDTDADGPVLITTATTDADDRIVQSDLAWGLYIVQFQGTAPDGRPMLPADVGLGGRTACVSRFVIDPHDCLLLFDRFGQH
jgi:hypothetical protein